MPVEFLTDDEAAAYGRYAGAPSQADLERVFFLDDDDRALAGRHRGEHMRAGSARTARARGLSRSMPQARVAPSWDGGGLRGRVLMFLTGHASALGRRATTSS
jgi:hypothetical protein